MDPTLDHLYWYNVIIDFEKYMETNYLYIFHHELPNYLY